MNVVSYFDGMSCGQIALDKLGIKVDNYFAYEIDKYAIKIAKKNYPKTKHKGSVTDVDFSVYKDKRVDLLLGGSPCQGFSKAGKQLNFADPRSKLFFDFVKAKELLNPKYFLLENVSMKKEYRDTISRYMGVEPIMINSSLVSAQNRKRYYWTNIPNVRQPRDRGIVLADIVGNLVTIRYNKPIVLKNIYPKRGQNGNIYSIEGKSKTLSAGVGIKGRGIGSSNSPKVIFNNKKGYRMLTTNECERLQTVPDGYTEGVSNTQRYKMLGNGWTVDVIAHIFKNIKIYE